MEYNKIDEQTIEKVETIPQEIIPAEVKTTQYDISFLKEQKIRVEEDLANIVARHSKELEIAQANVDEVNQLLAEADKLGIIEIVKVEEPIIDEPIVK